MRRPQALIGIAVSSAVVWLGGVAATANQVFPSNDIAQSKATYIIQVETTVNSQLKTVGITLPSGTNAGGAALGGVIVGERQLDAFLSVDPLSPDSLLVDLAQARQVAAGTNILVVLFNITNPSAGVHAIAVQTRDQTGNLVETVAPIPLSTTARGDIEEVVTGAGLAGGGTTGVVTLGVDTSQIQARVTGICPAGSAIREIDLGGNVGCEADDNSGGTVIAVTASPPLASSGGTAPDISLPHVTIEADKTAVGTSALASNTTGVNNTAAGANALFGNTTGSNNNAFGRQALVNNTTGSFNVALGASALATNTIGNFNTAIGHLALLSNTTASNNTAIGQQALRANTTGTTNTAVGNAALAANDGSNNMAVGASALARNTFGDFNTAAGHRALEVNTTGGRNTGIGRDALRTNTIGSNNTALGFGADVSAGNLTNATAIGNGAVVNASDKIRLGNDAVTVIEGAVAFSFTSDVTKKENFQPVDGEEVLKKIARFTLTSWNFLGQDAKQFRHYGPMAQDFFAAFGHDDIGTIGTPTTINAADIAGILMVAVQALEKRTAENAELRARLARLEQLIGVASDDQLTAAHRER